MSGQMKAADARAAEQARQRARRDADRALLDAHFADGVGGRGIRIATWAATALLTVGEIVGVITFRSKDHPSGGERLAAVVSLGLFGLGLVVFCWAIWAGAQRSRTHSFGIGGWFLLLGSAPRSVQWQMLGSVAAQLVVGIAAASIRPGSLNVAFGTLVWVLGLALCGLWGAKFGLFRERT